MSHKDCPFIKDYIAELQGKFIVVSLAEGHQTPFDTMIEAETFMIQSVEKKLQERLRFRSALQEIMSGFYKDGDEIKKLTAEQMQEIAINGFIG